MLVREGMINECVSRMENANEFLIILNYHPRETKYVYFQNLLLDPASLRG